MVFFVLVSCTWKERSREKGCEVMYCWPIVLATNFARATVSLSGRSVLTRITLSSSGIRFQLPAVQHLSRLTVLQY